MFIGARPHPPRHRPSILFCLKKRHGYWGTYDLSSGLRNSVAFIVEMLTDLGIRAEMQQFDNANQLDAAIKAFKPTNVIIEAFWVIPSKVAELQALYPHVSFAVRDHSETPFLAQEGNAIAWVRQYLIQGVEVMCNAPRAFTDMQAVAQAEDGRYVSLISYAPNFYPIGPQPSAWHHAPRAADDTIRIGCFGAIRQLKNQLSQAVAAIRFADFLGKKLEFHINGHRIEGGEPMMKNIKALFSDLSRYKLVTHPWLSHGDFLTLMAKMDFCMQCSFSETFNIVAADAVNCCVPVTGSAEIPWLGAYGLADPNDTTSMLNNLINANKQVKHHHKNNRILWQWRDLWKYSTASMNYWNKRFGAS